MKIEWTEKEILVRTQYHPALPARARKIGGKWDAHKKMWKFDIRDEGRVEELYRAIYGHWDTDGKPAADAVTVQVEYLDNYYEYCAGIFFGGRQVARATGRDSGAKLGNGVVLLDGKVGSGGSRKNWKTYIDAGTIVEIKDIPMAAVQAEIDNNDGEYEITIIGDINVSALTEEKNRLLARIAEIDTILDGQND